MLTSINFQLPEFEKFIVSTSSIFDIQGVEDKVADLTVLFSDNKPSKLSKRPEPFPILISEVGFSERYSQLESSMKMWLSSIPTIKVGLLVKIEETPKYKNPFRSRSREFWEFLQKPKEALKEDIILENSEEAGSPLWLSDLRLVGQTKAYMEVWVRDSDTGQARVQGERIVSHATLQKNIYI